MEQATQATLGEVVKQVAAAMSEAVKQYGPDAVDLALMAYRVEAAQQLVWGAVLLAPAIALLLSAKGIWAWCGKSFDPDFVRGMVLGLGGFFCLFPGVPGLQRLTDVSAWMAAFGYPELRIAIRALEAAGLM